jgi:hypothetical protein
MSLITKKDGSQIYSCQGKDPDRNEMNSIAKQPRCLK